MSAMKQDNHDPRHEPLDDDERVLMDPDTWDWDNPIEVVTGPSRGPVLEIRFTRDELSRLQRAARAEGMSTNAFIKQAALARLPHEAHR